MNIFDKVVEKDVKANALLSGTPAISLRLRLMYFAEMTKGRGFRVQPQPSKGLRKQARKVARLQMLMNIKKERELAVA